MFRQIPQTLYHIREEQTAVQVGDLVFKNGSTEDKARRLLGFDAVLLAQYMEGYWSAGHTVTPANGTTPLGHPNFLSLERSTSGPDVNGGTEIFKGFEIARSDEVRQFRPVRWDHLIYAYMIENTRLYEIFRRVLYEYRHGEKLGTPIDADTQKWLRSTEQLFYSEAAPFLVTNVSSHIRSDLRANRRNAYQRMFGMELNHSADDGKPYPYIKAEAANSDFVNTFEEFLREVWVGISNAGNTSGAKPTDDSKISELAEKLHDMLQSRRLAGNLAREEFAFVSMMSWFHLSLEFDSPIVKSLRADAIGVESRLFKIAERVGLPAHGLSKNFFDIAEPISRLLWQIEMDTYSKRENVPALYEPLDADGQPNKVESALRTIITHWTAITGRDVKARKVTAS